ncbi:hypothetical protein AGMMS4952_24590 [Spirochaetia bacterium]|nr:hypothetical protein AGMMS4952_24590 [Spirochaetia bacterium]
MKKQVFFIAVLLGMAALNAWAQAAPASDFKYDLDKAGTGVLIQKYLGKSAVVRIPETIEGYPVTVIGEWAFSNTSGIITSVVIPNSVTEIRERAFYDRRDLTTVTFPDKLVTIGKGAFKESGLTSVKLPDTVTTIEDETFYYCSDLTTVTFPNKLVRIGASAFNGCRSLRSVRIPDTVTSIGNGAFGACEKLTGVTLSASLITIGDYAFSDGDEYAYFGCPITEIVIPASVSSIGYRAFEGCAELKTVTLPPGLERIRGRLFYRCTALSAIAIPDSVTEIGRDAFSYCSSLESVTVSAHPITWNGTQFAGSPRLTLASKSAIRSAGYTGEF